MKAEVAPQPIPIVDYKKIPQRVHKYPASERAKKIVHEAITMDALFGTRRPLQWSSPEGPEFHDVMAQMHDDGFKVLAATPWEDWRGADFTEAIRALEFFLRKINEHPERYRIIRTASDIDEAIEQGMPGLVFTHQGVNQFGQDLDRVAVFRTKWFEPAEVLWQATSSSAELLALSGPRNPYLGKLGVIEEGAYVNLLLINGDPLKDISILTKPEDNLALIMKDGKTYKNTTN